MRDKLLTKDKLHAPLTDKICSLCMAENESKEHLFFQCHYVKQLWSSIKNWLGLHRSLSTLKGAVKWTINEARGTGIQNKAKKLGLISSVYFLWEARNLRIVEGKVQALEAIIRKIQISVFGVINYLYPDSLVYRWINT